MRKQTLIAFSLFALLMFGIAGQQVKGAPQAVALTADGEVRIGATLTITATGLTVGTTYVAVAVHSAGNLSSFKTAASTTEYFFITMIAADSDGVVPLYLNTAPGGVDAGDNAASAVTNLINPSSDIPTAFVQNLLPGVILIGIFVLILGVFALYKKRK